MKIQSSSPQPPCWWKVGSRSLQCIPGALPHRGVAAFSGSSWVLAWKWLNAARLVYESRQKPQDPQLIWLWKVPKSHTWVKVKISSESRSLVNAKALSESPKVYDIKCRLIFWQWCAQRSAERKFIFESHSLGWRVTRPAIPRWAESEPQKSTFLQNGPLSNRSDQPTKNYTYIYMYWYFGSINYQPGYNVLHYSDNQSHLSDRWQNILN